MLEFLPPRITAALRYVNVNRLYELRLRAGKPLRANLGGEFLYLSEHGIVTSADKALIPTTEEVEETLLAASDHSVYAVENQLRQGFVTGKAGERIGVAGSFVYEGKGVHSVHSITSLCVRIPHEIIGCADEIYSRCFSEGVCSLLLLSPPGIGKTTILRDLSRLICERTKLNVLVSDERGELAAGNLGESSDVIRFADKLTAFTAGIRAMRPDVIVTDELLPEDYAAVRRAVNSGIRVLASAHLLDPKNVPEKLFDRYVCLDGLGVIKQIYGEDGTRVD